MKHVSKDDGRGVKYVSKDVGRGVILGMDEVIGVYEQPVGTNMAASIPNRDAQVFSSAVTVGSSN